MSTTTKSAPITAISKYRALFLILAAEQGWKYTQVLTQVDQFTKGDHVITVKWGATQMVEFLHTQGKAIAPNGQVAGGAASKLQKLQTQMGKPMADGKKWAKLSPTKVKELETLATKTFKIKEA